MARPGIIIGLGGTGQWVLTWLKRDLLLANHGEFPNNVKLINIDTTTRPEARISIMANTDEDNDDVVAVGTVQLAPEEFIYIGGEARRLAERIRAGEYPNMEWFNAARLLNDLPPSAFTLDDGAGRLRAFGRLALYKDLMGVETRSNILRAFRTAINAVKSETSEERKLEIAVVASLAGGTGSGLFIDAALLLRMLTKELGGVHHVLRGFFALPSVFTTNPDVNMKARALAAWRELNRFMTVSPEFPMPPIEYVKERTKYQVKPDGRLYDACYLIGGYQKGKPVAEDARYSIFPAISETISAILDDEAGQRYTEWVFTNLAPEYVKTPDKPMYSALGAYSVQVPAHYIQEASTHVYAKELLLTLLKPKVQPDAANGIWQVQGAMRHLQIAAPNQNQEDPGYAGRERAQRLFQEKILRGETNITPSLFMGRIADLVEKYSDSHKQERQIIERLAVAGTDPRYRKSSWANYFSVFQDEAYEDLKKDLDFLLGYSIIRNYERKNKEKESDVRRRIKKLPDDIKEKFGIGTSDDSLAAHGKLGDVLERCSQEQLNIYKRVLEAYLNDLLNGRDEDALKAKSGKLGYVWDFLDGAVGILNKFLKLMDDVQHRREELKPELKIFSAYKSSERRLNSLSGKKLLFFFEHPSIKKAERAHFHAAQRLVNLQREDILHIYVRNTAEKMKEITEDARQSIQDWILTLSIGDDAASVSGLWDYVVNELRKIENDFGYDKRFVYSQIISQELIPYNEDDLRSSLAAWHWEVEVGEKTTINASMDLPDRSGERVAWVNPFEIKSKGERYRVLDKEQQYLITWARQGFEGLTYRMSVADKIKDEFKKPEDLVNAVRDKVEPLYSGSDNSPRKISMLIRVQAETNDEFFSEFTKNLRSKFHTDQGRADDDFSIEIVGSENPYKLTVVRTEDLIEYDGWNAWRDLFNGYEQQFTKADSYDIPPYLHHVFKPEQLAARFELAYAKKTGMYSPLHPWVVMLLEDVLALDDFLTLYALGKITRDEIVDGSYVWRLRLDGMHEPLWLTKQWNVTSNFARPSLIHAAHAFVVLKQNQSPYDQRVIDKGKVKSTIKNTWQYMYEEQMDEQEYNAFLKSWYLFQVENDEGVVAVLRGYANREDEYREEYRDLALVAEIRFEEYIRNLDDKLRGDLHPGQFAS